MIGGVAALALAGAGYLYVDHLQHENTRLAIQVDDLKKATVILNKNNAALGDELVAAQARAEFDTNLKEKVNAAASGTVPSDIRAALDGLRHH